MVTLSNEKVAKVKELYYERGFSVQDVANKFGVSIDAVFYCMRKHGFKRRKAYESNSIKFEKAKPSFELRTINNEKLRILKTIGTMLYWGEGSKAGTMTIDFANSDEFMIILFLKFLREICGVDEKKLRVYPYFYANQDINRNINFWKNITKISKKQFTKPYIRKDSREDKKNKMPYGLIHIRYSDKKLLRLIKSWIEDYKKF